MSEITLTGENFDEVLEKSEVLLVDLWAEWCGPCKMIAPTVAEIAKEFEGRASVGKVDIDESPSIATKYDVISIPTLLFFKKGELKAKLVGAQPKHIISKKMTEVLSSP